MPEILFQLQFVKFKSKYLFNCHELLIAYSSISLNTLMPQQNGRHFADNIFKCISLTGKSSIFIHISLNLFLWVNPLHAKFFRGNKNIYLYFMSLLHINMAQVVEIFPQVRQEPTNSPKSISWVLMSWQRKELGHQQSWYWLCWTKLIWFLHIKG